MHVDPTPTGPLSFEAKAIAKEIDARLRGDAPKFGERNKVSERVDGRLTKILAWIGGIASVLITGLMMWGISTVASTDKAVGILLDRPAPVSKAQYDVDRQEMKDDIKQIQKDVALIKDKQAEARQYGAR